MVQREFPSRLKLTKDNIPNLRPPDAKTLSFTRYWDKTVKGWCVRVTKSGFVTSEFCYTSSDGWRVMRMGELTPANFSARKTWAKALRKQVDRGGDPVGERKAERAEAEAAEQEIAKAAAARGPLVSDVLDQHVEKYLRKNKLRSADQIARAFERLVKPAIGSKGIHELLRSEITEMLNDIEEEHGSVMADRTLAYVRKAFNWYAVHGGKGSDNFIPPIVKGMGRTKPRERDRSRKLDDQEIRDVWAALDLVEKPSCYARYVRTLLLTGQRRKEVSGMTWDEIEDDVWAVPASRYKTKIDHEVPLSEAVREVIGTRTKGGGPFVFSTNRGHTGFGGYSKAKADLDTKLKELRAMDGRKPMERWTLHDLRRTGRSLMSRAGVPGDVGERVLGHLPPAIKRVYDRHEYRTEKRDALDKLAAMVATILNPPASDNVAKLDERRKAKARARNAREETREDLS